MKNQMLLIIGLITMGLGCFSYKNICNDDIIGKYSYRGVYGVSAELEVQKDGTFIYNWQEGLIFGVTKGTWLRDNNTLVLNSEKQPDPDTLYQILEYGKREQSGITINIVDESICPVPFAACVILVNGKEQERIGMSSNENGICFFNKDIEEVMINEIYIKHIDYHPVEYKLDKDKADNNFFTILIKEKESPYMYFVNQRWQIQYRIWDKNKCLLNGKRRFCKNCNR